MMKKTKKRKTYAFPEEATITRFSLFDHRKYLTLSWQTDDSLKSRRCVSVRLWRSPDFSTAVNIWLRHKMSSADIIAGMSRIKRRDGKAFGARTMRTLMAMKPSVRFLETWLAQSNHAGRKR